MLMLLRMSFDDGNTTRQRLCGVQWSPRSEEPSPSRWLKRIVCGRLILTPRVRAHVLTGEPDGYDFEGPTLFDNLFTVIAVETPRWIKEDIGTTGCEGIGPEDTFDGNYGRLLERAYEGASKVLASPSGIEDFYAGRGVGGQGGVTWRPQPDTPASRAEDDCLYTRIEGWSAA